MPHTAPILLSLIVFACFAIANAPAAGQDRSTGSERNERQQSLDLDVTLAVQMKYLLYLPNDYESKQRWPLLLFLHGAGERGDDLELVKKHGPPKLIARGREFPFIVVSPQCPADSWWQPTRLTALLDAMCETYKVDPARIYVSGLSMGGFGTWSLAAYDPDRFAAIAPICGGGEPIWGRGLKDLPAWAFHGEKDRLIPVERSTQMVSAIQRAGGQPKLTVYPDAGHDSWTETYNNQQLYDWLLEQRIDRDSENEKKN